VTCERRWSKLLIVYECIFCFVFVWSSSFFFFVEASQQSPTIQHNTPLTIKKVSSLGEETLSRTSRFILMRSSWIMCAAVVLCLWCIEVKTELERASRGRGRGEKAQKGRERRVELRGKLSLSSLKSARTTVWHAWCVPFFASFFLSLSTRMTSGSIINSSTVSMFFFFSSFEKKKAEERESSKRKESHTRMKSNVSKHTYPAHTEKNKQQQQQQKITAPIERCRLRWNITIHIFCLCRCVS